MKKDYHFIICDYDEKLDMRFEVNYWISGKQYFKSINYDNKPEKTKRISEKEYTIALLTFLNL